MARGIARVSSQVSSGCSQLDRLLRGGFPSRRTVLLTGGPGVGKSTLAMQFLQEGLEQGEECLYVSTEQTTDELQSSFEPFAFDLSHSNLAITSVHASPRTTLEESESGLALQTLQGDDTIDGPYTYPFEGEYIVDFLREYAPCDRVVLDSASGLAAISDDQDRFRRVILDLIRLFTDTFEATAVFTAEERRSNDGGSVSVGSSDVLQFSANGVIRLWWEELRGSRHRFLQVVKMRGVDHDTRNYEVGFSDRGLHLSPTGRTSPEGTPQEAIIPTGVRGLDELCGGLVRGHSVLLEYDGRAVIDELVARMIHGAFDAGMCVWLVPAPVMSANRLSALLPDRWDVGHQLSENRLFILDGFSAWQEYHDHRNVFAAPSGIAGNLFRRSSTVSLFVMKLIAEKIDERRDAPMLGTAYTEALLRWLDPDEMKESYYWNRENLAFEHDTGFFIHNPATMPAKLAEFFHSDAIQALEATMGENGIQYVHVNKSPVGEPGTSGVIDFTDDGLAVRRNG